MSQFAKAHPTDPIDVIISDYMSEGNMPVSAARKLASSAGATSPGTILDVSGPAFEPSFLEALEPALEDLAKHGIKVAVNAGASDTEGLYNVVVEMIKKKGLDIKCAWISGDEVLPQVDASLKNGTSQFKNIYTGEI